MVGFLEPNIEKGGSMKTWALGTVLSVWFCVPVFCQTSGEITGEVKDSAGAVIVGAKVVVTNTATSAVRETTTTGAGVYSFPSLQPDSIT